MLKTESVTTDKLRVGDVVYSHGGLFRLTTVRAYQEKIGTVYAWSTEAIDVKDCHIPADWIKTWTIQGNSLAKWARVTR